MTFKIQSFYVDKTDQGELREVTNSLVSDIGLEGDLLIDLELADFGDGLLHLNLLYNTKLPRTLLASSPPAGSIVPLNTDTDHVSLLFSHPVDSGELASGDFTFDSKGLSVTSPQEVTVESGGRIVRLLLPPSSRSGSGYHSIEARSGIKYLDGNPIQHTDIVAYNVNDQLSPLPGQPIPYTAELGRRGKVSINGLKIDKSSIPSERINSYLRELGVTTDRIIKFATVEIAPSLVYVVFAYFKTLEPQVVSAFPYNNSLVIFGATPNEMVFVFREQIDAPYVRAVDGLFKHVSSFGTVTDIAASTITVDGDLKTVRINTTSVITTAGIYDFRIGAIAAADGTLSTQDAIYTIQALGFTKGAGGAVDGSGAPISAPYLVSAGHAGLSNEKVFSGISGVTVIDAGNPFKVQVNTGYVYTSSVKPASGSLQTNINTNTSSIGTNVTNIAANTSSISTNTTNIATNVTNISGNTTAISTNSGDLNTHTGTTSTHGVLGNIVGTSNSQTLINKTLTQPVIANFTNATHTHAGGSQGGIVPHGNLSSIGTLTHTQLETRHVGLSGRVSDNSGDIGTNTSSISINTTAIADNSGDLAAHTGATVTHGVAGNIVGTTDSQTLINKTLTTPTIGNFTSANHSHTSASAGGKLDHTQALTNIGTNTHAQIDAALGANSGDIISVETDVTANTAAIASTSGDLATHTGDTSTHGITSTIVGISETQSLSNKTYVTPIIGSTDWSTANHAHADSLEGGIIPHTNLSSIGTLTHTQLEASVVSNSGDLITHTNATGWHATTGSNHSLSGLFDVGFSYKPPNNSVMVWNTANNRWNHDANLVSTHILAGNSAKNTQHSLSGLAADVHSPLNATSGSVIVYDTSTSKWTMGSAYNMDIHFDLNSTPADGSVLIYDTANGRWKPGSAVTANLQYADVSPGSGELMVYNNTEWTPATAENISFSLSLNETPSEGDVLAYDLNDGVPRWHPKSTGAFFDSSNSVTEIQVQPDGQGYINVVGFTGQSNIRVHTGLNTGVVYISGDQNPQFTTVDIGATVAIHSNADSYYNAPHDFAFGTTQPDRKLHVEEDTATTNAVTQVLRLTSTSSSTPANGIGAGMEFEVETAAGNEVGAIIEAVCTDVGSGIEDFDLVIKTMTAGATAAEKFRIESDGDISITNGRLQITEDSATTNAVTQVLRLTSTSSGTPANGIGVGMEFEVETTAGNEVGATIECVSTDVGSGTEDFDLVFKTMVAGISADPRLTLSASALMTHHGAAVGNGFDCNDAHIGTWIGSVNFAVFAHKAVKATAGSYSMLAQNDGATYLNAASSKLIYFRINNATTMHLGANALHFADLKGIYLGTGDDAAVYYDGSNLVVDPKVVGSGKIVVPGSVYVADGFATGGSSRNAHITCWSDEAFGMELSGIGGAPCLLVYGRASDTDSIKFGTYTANSTAQSDFVQRAVLTSAGGFGVGVSAPAAGKVDASGGFADNGTAGIDKTFAFTDGNFLSHSVIISGGIITQWNIA